MNAEKIKFETEFFHSARNWAKRHPERSVLCGVKDLNFWLYR
jgi:hypothetical protein